MIDLYQKGGTGAIKVLSENDLDRLTRKATDDGWSANGRPEWFAQHRDQFRTANLVVFGPEGSALLRCIVTVLLSDGSGGRFTLDASRSDVDALDDMSDKDLLVLAHRYLATFPPIDLEQSQGGGATWGLEGWMRWGKSVESMPE